MTHKALGFEISISSRDDGTLEAMYIRLSDDKVATTKEIRDDVLLADYSASGELVGIEILAPVRLKDLVRLVDQPKRAGFRRFVEETAPEELVLANSNDR
jgi:hypothetical protein